MCDKSAVDNRRSPPQQPVNVAQMPESLCRVTVHCAGVSTDLTLPTALPVAELVPPIVDLLGGAPRGRHRLSCIGGASMPNSTTLAQNGIRDGAVLILSRVDPLPPVRRCDDDAAAVAAALGTATQSREPGRLTGAVAAGGLTAVGAAVLVRNAFVAPAGAGTAAVVAGGAAVGALAAAGVGHRGLGDPVAGLALSLVAAIFAGVAGLLAVPGPPGAPNVLLAAMTTAAATVLAMRITHCGTVTLAALACCAVVGAVAALAEVISGAPPHIVGSIMVPVCLGLIEMAPRISMALTGLSPMCSETELAHKGLRADKWLTSIRGACATASAVAAVLAALSDHRAVMLAVVTGAVLLWHSRTDRSRAMMFAATGIATLTITFAIWAIAAPAHGPWIAALTATLTAGAIYLDLVAPRTRLSPATQRIVDSLGCLALITVVPVVCWTCGAFSTVRGLNLHP